MIGNDQFQFSNSEAMDGVTLLEARMTHFSYPRHAHEEYSFAVTMSGDQKFFSRGQYHTSRPGNVILFNPEDIHDGCAGEGGGLHYLMLYLSPDCLRPFLQSAGWQGNSDFRLRDLVSENAGLQQALLRLAARIKDEQASEFEQEECLYMLAACLAQFEGVEGLHRTRTAENRMLAKAKDYIHAHIRDEISLDDLGRELNMSKFHFLRLFREQTGITPYQYVLSRRVEQARKALHHGEAVSGIACDYGFFDLSHFNRRFKAVFGVTPAAYQKSILN